MKHAAWKLYYSIISNVTKDKSSEKYINIKKYLFRLHPEKNMNNIKINSHKWKRMIDYLILTGIK